MRPPGGLVFWLPLEEARRRFGLERDQLTAAVGRGELSMRAKVGGGEVRATVSSSDLIRLFGPPVAIPTLVIDYEPSERFLAPRKSPEEVPVAQLVATVEGAAKPAGAVALDTHTEAVLADRGAPFRAASELLSGWFLLPPAAAPASGADPATEADPGADPDQPPERRPVTVEGVVGTEMTTRLASTGDDLPDLLLRRDGARIQLAMRSKVATPATELVILEPLPTDADGRLHLFWAPPGRRLGLGFVITVGPDASAEAAAAARSAIPGPTAPADTGKSVWPTRLARDAVGEASRRRALLALAERLGLPRCVDLLLCLDEPALVAVTAALPADASDPPLVARAIWSAMLPMLQRGEASPALRACLRRHLGVLVFDLTGFEFALAIGQTIAEFNATLVERNLDALEARRASRRVVAATWLRKHGHELGDYDPLAPREQRRAALHQLHGTDQQGQR